ncbi:MAG: hypothetical protein ACREXT_00365, partial [Gammaproteobacteria bacterium]
IEVPRGLNHGDFSVSNLRIGDEAELGLIDWESSVTHGVPILDAINYLDSVLRLSNPGQLINRTLPALARGEGLMSSERRLLAALQEFFVVDPKMHEALCYLRWLRHVGYLSHHWLRQDLPAQRVFIHEVIAGLPPAT